MTPADHSPPACAERAALRPCSTSCYETCVLEVRGRLPEVVGGQLARFGPDAASEGVVGRLRAVASGAIDAPASGRYRRSSRSPSVRP